MLRKLIVIVSVYYIALFFLKLPNLGEVFLQGILFYIVCVGGGDIDMRKFVWDNYFGEKEYWCKNLVVSNSDRKKTISIEIYNRTKK